MQRNVGAELAHDPLAHCLDLGRRIVLAGDQQRRDLEPDVGLVLQVNERIQYRLQMRTAELHVELVGEPLEVHVRRVHLGVELASRCGADVAGGDRDRLDAARMAGVSRVHRIFRENHRIVVREGNAA